MRYSPRGVLSTWVRILDSPLGTSQGITMIQCSSSLLSFQRINPVRISIKSNRDRRKTGRDLICSDRVMEPKVWL